MSRAAGISQTQPRNNIQARGAVTVGQNWCRTAIASVEGSNCAGSGPVGYQDGGWRNGVEMLGAGTVSGA